MRKNTKKVDIIIIAVILLIIAAVVLVVILKPNEKEQSVNVTAVSGTEVKYTDYDGKRLGIVTGSSFEQPTFEHFPNSEYSYYDNISDLILALQQDKIDGFVQDEPVLRMASIEQPTIWYFKECLRNDTYSIAFQKTGEKSSKLKQQFDEMLSELNENGTLDEMKKKWFSVGSVDLSVDRSGITGENGILSVAVNPTNVPFAMISNGELSGYAVELVTMFCRRYGYDCKYDQVNTASGLAGLASGVYDIYANNTTVTPERAESVSFSKPIYEGGITLAVRASDISSDTSGGISKDTPLSYFLDKKIGILTGSAYEPVAEELFPNAEYVYFDVASDLALATVSGKIDGYLMSVDQAETMKAENPQLIFLNEDAGQTPYAFAFPKTDKGAALRDEINEFLGKIRADGTMDKLLEKWVNGDLEQSVDMTGFTGEKGVLKIASDGTTPPWEYTYSGKLTGYEIELVAMFCREYGYTPKFDTMTFAAVIPAISSEKYDMAAANISVTKERAESVYFSDKESGSKVVFVTADITAQTGSDENSAGFFESIAQSFEKNFIREDRWKMILDGIGTTCLITVMSTLFGTILAFLICMFRRTGSRLANAISNIYVKLLQGTPMVVLLMILYYVILGKSGLDAVWVAVIGFSLNVGAYVSEIMRSGIESIDGGQREAALALGYNENQAFFRFIFPQAAVRFLPVYKQEIVSLLKSTSIVGYIAIQDLTKMSDIIRSRTYEAFFPLIATAIIYFILAWIISIILKYVLKAVSPKRKRGTAK